MTEITEFKPFRINFKKEDKTIFSVRKGILCIFFRGDYGWLNVPDDMYNRTWSYINSKGVTYIPESELDELSKKYPEINS